MQIKAFQKFITWRFHPKPSKSTDCTHDAILAFLLGFDDILNLVLQQSVHIFLHSDINHVITQLEQIPT